MSTLDRVRKAAKLTDINERNEAITKLIQDPSFSRSSLEGTFLDPDPAIREVSSIALAQSPGGFTSVDVLKYWELFAQSKTDVSTLFVAHLVSKERSSHSHELWRRYIQGKVQSSKVIEAYCMEDEAFVVQEIMVGKVSGAVFVMIEKYAQSNKRSALLKALNLRKRENSDL